MEKDCCRDSGGWEGNRKWDDSLGMERWEMTVKRWVWRGQNGRQCEDGSTDFLIRLLCQNWSSLSNWYSVCSPALGLWLSTPPCPYPFHSLYSSLACIFLTLSVSPSKSPNTAAAAVSISSLLTSTSIHPISHQDRKLQEEQKRLAVRNVLGFFLFFLMYSILYVAKGLFLPVGSCISKTESMDITNHFQKI